MRKISKKIKRNGRPGDAWVYRQLQPWITKWKQELSIEGFIPFDASTIGHVFYPDYFKYHRDIPVGVSERENDSPAFLDAEQKPYLEVSYDLNSLHTVDFAFKAKSGYKEMIMKHLLSN